MRKQESQRTIIFKVVYLGICGCGFERKIIRKIELRENQTLDDLQKAIICQSFKWNDPHLYSFFLDNKPFSENRKMEYTCDPESDREFDEEKPNLSNVELKELNFQKNQKFLFIFDFGDEHQFKITVKGFGEFKRGTDYPQIIESMGEAPKQYG